MRRDEGWGSTATKFAIEDKGLSTTQGNKTGARKGIVPRFVYGVRIRARRVMINREQGSKIKNELEGVREDVITELVSELTFLVLGQISELLGLVAVLLLRGLVRLYVRRRLLLALLVDRRCLLLRLVAPILATPVIWLRLLLTAAGSVRFFGPGASCCSRPLSAVNCLKA